MTREMPKELIQRNQTLTTLKSSYKTLSPQRESQGRQYWNKDIFIRTDHPIFAPCTLLNCFIGLIKIGYKKAFCTFISFHVFITRAY